MLHGKHLLGIGKTASHVVTTVTVTVFIFQIAYCKAGNLSEKPFGFYLESDVQQLASVPFILPGYSTFTVREI